MRFLSDILSNTYVIKSIYTLLSFFVIVLLSRVTKRAINNNIQDLKKRHRLRKLAFYIFAALFCISLLGIWTTNFPSLTTILSFTGAGLALTLHEVVLCFVGWLTIIIKKLYDVGERIEINGIKGDVIDIGIMHTLMLEVGNWVKADQSTGRLVTVANSAVFRSQVYNYTKEFQFIWHEIEIIVTFESNSNKARDIILSIANEDADKVKDQMKRLIANMSENYVVQYRKLTPAVYTRIVDNGILLTLRYLTEPHKRRDSENRISRAIIEAFDRERDIDFAYPTTRFYQFQGSKC